MIEAKTPTNKISRIKLTIIVSWRLLSLLWKIDKWLVLGNMLVVSIPAIIPLLIGYIFKLLIDQVILITSGRAPNNNLILLIVIAGFATYVFQSLAFSAQDFLGRLLYTKIPVSLYQMILSKVSSLDMAYFEDSEFKSTLEKVRDSYTFRPLNMMDNLLFTFQGLVQMIASLIVLASLNIYLIFVVILVAIPEFINRAKQSQLAWGIWDANSPFRKKFWYVSSLLQERDAIKEMKIFKLPSYFLTELKSLHEKFYQDNKNLAVKYLGINTLFNLFEGFAFIGILLYIIFQTIARRLTIGDISYYTSAATNFQNAIGGLFRNVVKLFEGSLYISSIFEVLDAKPKIKQVENPIEVKLNRPPLIEFRNVRFTYQGSTKPILKNFDLVINPGEKIALVGENGSGKTTIIKLLCRFYDVDRGEILINGKNIKDLDLESWYKAVGVLFQDFVKYEYSAKENIFFGKVYEKMELKKIIDSAISSGADPFIKKLEQGYEQMLGRTFEGGIELSVGQWQRLALARGFFRNAPILILDEPTASIDAKAEAEIFNRVEKLSKNKTVIIISHRFSTVRNADKIYVIDNGQIIESGSHKQLMEINGQYATLFNLQAKGYK